MTLLKVVLWGLVALVGPAGAAWGIASWLDQYLVPTEPYWSEEVMAPNKLKLCCRVFTVVNPGPNNAAESLLLISSTATEAKDVFWYGHAAEVCKDISGSPVTTFSRRGGNLAPEQSFTVVVFWDPAKAGESPVSSVSFTVGGTKMRRRELVEGAIDVSHKFRNLLMLISSCAGIAITLTIFLTWWAAMARRQATAELIVTNTTTRLVGFEVNLLGVAERLRITQGRQDNIVTALKAMIEEGGQPDQLIRDLDDLGIQD